MSANKAQPPGPPKIETAASHDGGNLVNTRRITSDALMAGQRELIIEHSGEAYRLSITSKGKLILTK